MKKNPFVGAESPIAQLYQRSKSKSVENTLPTRTRSRSFKQFKIGIIRTALQQHRVIQKEYNLTHEKNMHRERQYSRYYGYDAYSYLHLPPLAQPALPSTPSPLPYLPDLRKEEERRASDRMSTMLYIRTETMNAINSHRAMTFESNFNIQTGPRQSQHVPSEICVASERLSSQASSHRSSERKCSIFNELSKGCAEANQNRKISMFLQHKQSREDHIKEQYFDEPAPKSTFKRPSHRDSTRETPLFCLI